MTTARILGMCARLFAGSALISVLPILIAAACLDPASRGPLMVAASATAFAVAWLGLAELPRYWRKVSQ